MVGMVVEMKVSACLFLFASAESLCRQRSQTTIEFWGGEQAKWMNLVGSSERVFLS